MDGSQVGDIPQRVPASGGGNGSSMSSAAILFCFTAGTFNPHATSPLQAGSELARSQQLRSQDPMHVHAFSTEGVPCPRNGEERTRRRERVWRRDNKHKAEAGKETSAAAEMGMGTCAGVETGMGKEKAKAKGTRREGGRRGEEYIYGIHHIRK